MRLSDLQWIIEVEAAVDRGKHEKRNKKRRRQKKKNEQREKKNRREKEKNRNEIERTKNKSAIARRGAPTK